MTTGHADDLRITHLQNEFFDDWDRYVEEHKEGSFFHLSGWKTVIESRLCVQL